MINFLRIFLKNEDLKFKKKINILKLTKDSILKIMTRKINQKLHLKKSMTHIGQILMKNKNHRATRKIVLKVYQNSSIIQRNP